MNVLAWTHLAMLLARRMYERAADAIMAFLIGRAAHGMRRSQSLHRDDDDDATTEA